MSLHLDVERVIAASPERLFEAWTTPALLTKWWGPADITCDEAQVDLRVGGEYRLSNRTEDGQVLWISGTFETIEPPSRLVYSWRLGDEGGLERVTVTFDAVEGGTRVSVHHEQIGSEPMREGHLRGWEGCLDGLVALLASAADVSA